jgi:protein TonB
MKTNLMFHETMDDIVFEHRNKSYGAFMLRKLYAKHMTQAMFFSCSLFCLLFLINAKSSKSDKLLDPYIIGCPFDDNISIILRSPPEYAAPRQINESKADPTHVVEDKKIVEEKITKSNNDILPFTNSSSVGDGTGDISAQTGNNGLDTNAGIMVTKVPEPVIEKEVAVTFAEEMPEFTGGYAKMVDYLMKNLKYPSLARETGIQGRVVLSFVVAKDGRLQDISLIRGIGGGCDEEAIRVVSKMPTWKAGKHNGKYVPVKFTLPISFRLE